MHTLLIPESPKIWQPPPLAHSSNYRNTKHSLFVELPLPDWQTLRRLRMQVTPYPNCKLYTVVYSVNVDGTPGDAIVGWPGESIHLQIDPWWDTEIPWAWFTTSFITTTSASNQSGNNPATWNSASNTIEVIGSGGGGYSNGGTPGGAAAYAKSVNITLTPSAAVTFFGNVGGTGSTANSGGVGAVGPDAWYNGTSLGASSCGAKGGFAGDSTNWGAPGLASGCIYSGSGSTAYSGGTTQVYSPSGYQPHGGAGAAGPGGAGGQSSGGAGETTGDCGGGGGGANGGGGDGVAVTNTVNIGKQGGTSISTGSQTGAAGGAGAASNVAGGTPTAGSGAGGGGGWGDSSGNVQSGGAGAAGSEWDASHGSGGGAGGGGSTTATSGTAGNGANGALYGAGGGPGGCSVNTPNFNGAGGTGAQYIIVLTWSPSTIGLVLTDTALDAGLSAMVAGCDKLHICSTEPTSFADVGTYTLGNKVVTVFGALAAGSPNGRKSVVAAISGGNVTGDGTAVWWAAVDSVGSKLYSKGQFAAPVVVTSGQTFTLTTFTVHQPSN